MKISLERLWSISCSHIRTFFLPATFKMLSHSFIHNWFLILTFRNSLSLSHTEMHSNVHKCLLIVTFRNAWSFSHFKMSFHSLLQKSFLILMFVNLLTRVYRNPFTFPFSQIPFHFHIFKSLLILTSAPLLTLRSPEMLAPASIPVAAGKNTLNTEKKDSPPRKSGNKFCLKTSPER